MGGADIGTAHSFFNTLQLHKSNNYSHQTLIPLTSGAKV